MVEIVLTPSQIMQGAFVGIMRQVSNIQRNRNPAYGVDDTADWQLHCEGALGEMALALHLGRFWDGALNKMRAADVGDMQVRTAAQHSHRLIIHPNDADNATFYLLTGRNGRYIVQGSITGANAKRQEWWQDPKGGRPAYFVPQSALDKYP